MANTGRLKQSPIAHFNEAVARRATLVFGTMGMFYAFVLYSVMPFVDPAHAVNYLTYSNDVQLVALPLIMVGTNILGRDSEKRAMETHDAVMEELGLLREAHTELTQLVGSQQQLPAVPAPAAGANS